MKHIQLPRLVICIHWPKVTAMAMAMAIATARKVIQNGQQVLGCSTYIGSLHTTPRLHIAHESNNQT